ncbi:TonB-dependent receptor plug domain-containing protein [Halosquirtibacter laminarini]|uniref:TonB-dependent receptor plug domain-containing protein n=1 Tax=Halosquirtibacter laminarini TaxID=3374600 RepID=A0AC61NHM0_9BACT|nr:TonB-dependent receptor plug domain-containing protein [Prolixibacteraceae bacterium]
MKNSLFILLIWMTFTINHSEAQVRTKRYTVYGVITDKTDGKPLAGCSVYIKALHKGTTTDANGHYSITTNKQSFQITYSFIGYKTEEVISTLSKKRVIQDMALVPSSEQLGDVVITAKSEARKIRETALPVSVISMNALQGTVSDINEVLSKTAGVNIRSTGGVGSASKISVRGLEGKRVGFYIDGNSMNDNLDFVSINDIPVDLIDRIEIYKGIVPAKFGGSSIGGAVNIVLKEYPPKYMDFSYTIRSYNTHQVSTALKTNKNGFEMGIGGFYTYSDNNYKMQLPLRKGLNTQNTNQITEVTRNHDNYEKIGIGGGFNYKAGYFDKLKIEPTVVVSSKQVQGINYPILNAHSKSTALIAKAILEKEDFLWEGMDLNFENTFTHSIYQFVDTAQYSYDWEMNRRPAISEYGGEIGKNPNNSNNVNQSLLQRLNLNYIINKKQSINFNWHFQYANGKPKDELKDKAIGYQTNFNSKMHSITIGVNHEYHTLGQFFTNSATLKYHYYDIDTRAIAQYGMSRVKDIQMNKSDYGVSEAIRLRFTPDFLFKSSVVYDVRIPTNQELLGDGYIITPSGDLMPEKNFALNAGWMYTKERGTRKLIELEFNAFYNHLDNMIRFKGGPLLSKYENFGTIETKGVELEVKSDVTNFLYLWGNITYQDLRDKRKNLPNSVVVNPTYDSRMPNIPYLIGNIGLELHQYNLWGGRGQNTRLYADATLTEEYYYDFEQSSFQERKIPRSCKINAGLEQSFGSEKIFFVFQVNNLTNQRIMSEYNKPLPLRNYGFKVRYVFK